MHRNYSIEVRLTPLKVFNECTRYTLFICLFIIDGKKKFAISSMCIKSEEGTTIIHFTLYYLKTNNINKDHCMADSSTLHLGLSHDVGTTIKTCVRDIFTRVR